MIQVTLDATKMRSSRRESALIFRQRQMSELTFAATRFVGSFHFLLNRIETLNHAW